MNFLERIKTGRLFFYQRKKKDTPLNTIPDIIVKFFFKDQIYILENFEINFRQELNEKGKPGGLPTGGIMSLTMAETPDYSLNEWILKDNLLYSGEIRILSNSGNINAGALLTIKFVDAHCVGYSKKIRSQEGGLFTTFTISPRYVKFGNEEFENKWKNSERYSHNVNIYSLDKE